jgi:transcriptional regulator PpsR
MKPDKSEPPGNPFLSQGRTFKDMNPETVADLISATSDITLMLSGDGRIRTATTHSPELAALNVDSWQGEAWTDTVTVESRPKIRDLLNETAEHGSARWRQVNHAVDGGADVPIRYTAYTLPNGYGMIAVGQDQSSLVALQQRLVETQQSVEREYARLRLVETRYRLLFQVTGEPVVIVDASYKIRECNAAAAQVLGESSDRLRGRGLLSKLDTADRAAIETYLEQVRHSVSSTPIAARLSGSDAEVSISAHLFRQNGATHYLIRMPVNDPGAVGEDSDPGLAELIEALPDGFVVTDADHRILSANMAFVELAQMVDAKQIRNEPLYRWLGRSPVDFRVMLKAIGGDGRIRNYPTVLQGELGSRDDVIVSIVRKDIGRDARHAVIVRPVGEAERAGQAEASAPALDRSVEQLADLVGRVPMKDIVRDTTDLIERMCIEAALERTGDNRASAADILGLSRQSLYVKLRRFGMGSGDTD